MNHVGPGIARTLPFHFLTQSGVNSPSIARVLFANMWSSRAIMRVVWLSEKSLVKVLPSTV